MGNFRGGLTLIKGQSNEYIEIELWTRVETPTTTGTLEIPTVGGGTIPQGQWTIQEGQYEEGETALAFKTNAMDERIDELAEDTLGNVLLIDVVAATYTWTVAGGVTPVYPFHIRWVVLIQQRYLRNVDWDYVRTGSPVPSSVDTVPRFTAAGTDTYTGVVAGVTAYNLHDTYVVLFTNANTGASTLNINTLGAVGLVKNVSDALVAADIAAGKELIVVYDGVNFQVIGISVEAHTIQVTNGSLGTVETTGNKAFIDPTYNFTAISWELTGEIEAGGNASLKIDIQEAGVSLVGVGHTYPQMTAVAVAASPAKASATGSCADWTTKVFDMSKHYDFLVDSVTNTERWRLTIYGYRT